MLPSKKCCKIISFRFSEVSILCVANNAHANSYVVAPLKNTKSGLLNFFLSTLRNVATQPALQIQHKVTKKIVQSFHIGMKKWQIRAMRMNLP